MSSNRIFETESASIDFHPNALGLRRKLAFTFTALNSEGANHVALEFGVKFLHRRGFDVIAFKSGKPAWYQDIPLEVSEDVDRFLSNLNHLHDLRVGYGMSMGGSGAIKYSKALRLDRILAFSPQVAAITPWDKRWLHVAEPGTDYLIGPANIRNKADYFLVFDSNDQEDAAHVAKFREIISRDRIHLLNIINTGHMTGYSLQQAGLLGSLVESVLSDGLLPDIRAAFRAKRRKVPIYLVRLAGRLGDRHRANCAIYALDAALACYFSQDGRRAAWTSDRVGPYIQESQYLTQLGRLEEASINSQLAIDEARSNDPHALPTALVERASLYDRDGNYEAALALLDEALALRPNYPPFFGYRANYLLGLGRYDEAIAAARRQIEIAPKSGPAHFSFAHVAMACGRHSQALPVLREAVRLEPLDLDMSFSLAHLLQFLGQYEESISILKNILERRPGDCASRANLSHAFFHCGLLPEALAEIDAALMLEATNGDYHSHRGTLCFHLGRVEEAVQCARRAVECNPASPHLRAALEHVDAAARNAAVTLKDAVS